MQLFDKALALKPTALIYINRSQVRPSSDTQGKITDLDEAIKLEPFNVDALLLKADLLAKEGKNAEALAVLDNLPKTVAAEPWGRTRRAVLLYKAGRQIEAKRAFSELDAQSTSASEFNSLCWTKATEDMLLDSALKDCQQALKLSPDTANYLDSLGMVFLKLGRLDEALDAYTKALANKPRADSLMGRAFVYLKKGDAVHAKADADAARKLNSKIDDTFAEYGLRFDQPTTASAKATTKTAAN
jgi:tetratricopeptide (TPR) repeat protein